jgi:hypothetical protein
MDKSKKTKTTQGDLQKSSASDHTLTDKHFNWISSSTTDHVYFNDEWNGEYED